MFYSPSYRAWYSADVWADATAAAQGVTLPHAGLLKGILSSLFPVLSVELGLLHRIKWLTHIMNAIFYTCSSQMRISYLVQAVPICWQIHSQRGEPLLLGVFTYLNSKDFLIIHRKRITRKKKWRARELTFDITDVKLEKNALKKEHTT